MLRLHKRAHGVLVTCSGHVHQVVLVHEPRRSDPVERKLQDEPRAQHVEVHKALHVLFCVHRLAAAGAEREEQPVANMLSNVGYGHCEAIVQAAGWVEVWQVDGVVLHRMHTLSVPVLKFVINREVQFTVSYLSNCGKPEVGTGWVCNVHVTLVITDAL